MKRNILNISFVDRPEWGRNIIAVTGEIQEKVVAFSTTDINLIYAARFKGHSGHEEAVHKIKSRLNILYNWSQNIECSEAELNNCF